MNLKDIFSGRIKHDMVTMITEIVFCGGQHIKTQYGWQPDALLFVEGEWIHIDTEDDGEWFIHLNSIEAVKYHFELPEA